MVSIKTIAALSLMTGLSLPLSAMAADWTIDPAHSTLAFSGTQTGAPFSGHFGSFDGTISFDPAHPEAGQAHVTIAMSSAVTGDRQRDGALPGKDWFDVAGFPSAVFDAQNFKAKGGDAYEAAGTLVIRGISKPVTLPFKLDIDGATLHVKGHLDLVRSAFGIGQGVWATGQWVALEVGVDLDVTAQRKP
ncbi:YceI family protein [Acetobacter sp.]|jgi:polyisoprenoid-binding protein YceI|uniref:YceI family protein n=1 Tax=Acetobacter sp. TaxID=440 RepID=UPI0025C3FD51|nr:YceI family protein [Acetobacter sp.]MCH4091459.1 YceI family protein [Acetobacter sp.]MCI1299437.1 YceI family protein [Acetobacter sp.]MCI1316973.1 YceI family protein [Acetobacter sp.]